MERQTRVSIVSFVLIFFFVILHNLVFAAFGFEDPVSFLLAVAALFTFFASVLYNTYTHLRRGKPKDLWKIGFIGFSGMLGFFASRTGLYGLFGFFGFFGMRKEIIQGFSLHKVFKYSSKK